MSSPTPTGVLRGVAAFDWDGTAWQPAAQARSSVPTPYGVLDGVARFGWTGSAWAAVGAPSLSLDFMTPGQLDPRITYTRASTATYTDASGTIQTAAINAPRWDYDPITHALRGVLIEEARTNLVPNSGDAGNVTWQKSGITVAAPTVTSNQAAAPDGTLTAARVVLPAVPAAGNATILSPLLLNPGTVNPYTFSVWLRGNAGGEMLYLNTTVDGVNYYRTQAVLTTAWQRFTLTTPNLTTGAWYFQLGADRRDAGQAATLAQTVFVWGAQIEVGTFATSYIPTTFAAVTRAQDLTSMSTSPWMTPSLGSWMAEFVLLGVPTNIMIIGATAAGGQTPLTAVAPNQIGSYDGAAVIASGTFAAGNITKAASAFGAGTGKVCLNGGAVTSGAQTGFTMNPIGFIEAVSGVSVNNGSGHMRRVQYWPRVLSDAEMRAVTS
jgi:hypothetical protein